MRREGIVVDGLDTVQYATVILPHSVTTPTTTGNGENCEVPSIYELKCLWLTFTGNKRLKNKSVPKKVLGMYHVLTHMVLYNMYIPPPPSLSLQVPGLQ